MDEEDFEELLSAAAARTEAPTGRSWFNGLLWLLSLVPVAALALLGSMAVRVRLDQGRWPVRNQPDPKELGLHNTITVAAILISFAVVLLVPIIALARHFASSRRVPVVPPVLAVVSLAILFIILAADIGGLGEWIGD